MQLIATDRATTLEQTVPESGTEAKFQHPQTTADGSARAFVTPSRLETLWFNTGTLCNLTCTHCYIESSPSNDSLVYLTLAEVQSYLDEIDRESLKVREIGFTGGEPFMNPDFIDMLYACTERGLRVLVLTNAMRPMMKCRESFAELVRRQGELITVRVSVDHFQRQLHEQERGLRSWQPMVDGFAWLAQLGVDLQVAARLRWGDSEHGMRAGFEALFTQLDVDLDAHDPQSLVLFAEMDENAEVPEITTDCWQILDQEPTAMMCASSRMVVKHKGQRAPEVVACTLLPYDADFNLGTDLKGSLRRVYLNHRYCAQFCVLGGSSCS